MAGEEIPREVPPQVQERVSENKLANEGLQSLQTGVADKRMSPDKGLESFSNAKDILDPKNMARKDIVDQLASNDKAVVDTQKTIKDIEERMANVLAAQKQAENANK